MLLDGAVASLPAIFMAGRHYQNTQLLWRRAMERLSAVLHLLAEALYI
jgi:hypothetical protein